MKNRQSAKVRGVMRDLERERHERQTLEVTLWAAIAFVTNDGVAATHQTLGQYRSALLKLLASQLSDPAVAPTSSQPERSSR